jgi:hypothetical protein
VRLAFGFSARSAGVDAAGMLHSLKRLNSDAKLSEISITAAYLSHHRGMVAGSAWAGMPANAITGRGQADRQPKNRSVLPIQRKRQLEN